MKYLLLAQPKSASTSLMTSIGKAADLSYGQQYTARRTVPGMRERAVRKLANTALRLSGAAERLDYVDGMGLDRFSHLFPAPGYGFLSRIHADIGDFTDIAKDQITFAFDLHKQHFPPTEANKALFREMPKVILLRSAEASVASYLRASGSRTNRVFQEALSTRPQFRQQVLEELTAWQNGWQAAAQAQGGHVVWFDEMIADPEATIMACCAHLGLTVTNPQAAKTLAKERYSKG